MLPTLVLMLSTVSAAPIDTLVVCPPEFRSALEPWIAYRTGQGHQIEVISNALPAVALRSRIRDMARSGALQYVLLVGDADPARERDPRAQGRLTPTQQVPAKVTPQYGSEPTIASDNWYADLDDDRVPELAIGRLTADSPQQLAAIVQKILDHERNTDYGAWRGRINLLAGAGGFGALVDAAVEGAAKRVIAAGVPPAYTTRVTFGNWRSPYCPDPRQFRRTAIDSLGEGSLCWVYLGHAWPDRLANLQVPGGGYGSLASADLLHVRCQHGAPIACLLACYTGAFDKPNDCLAEAMLAAPEGPVAVVCGSRVTMPYAMAVLGTELLDEIFQRKPETIGRALLGAKRRMLAPTEPTATRQGLDALANLLNPGSADDELIEHLDLFNLLGDPLLRLKLPKTVAVTCEREAAPGSVLMINATAPISGRASIELVPRRDLLTFRAPERRHFSASAEQFAEFDDTYRRANDACLARHELVVDRGKFTARLVIPETASGPCHVRVFIEGNESHAAGSADVELRNATEEDVARIPSGGAN